MCPKSALPITSASAIRSRSTSTSPARSPARGSSSSGSSAAAPTGPMACSSFAPRRRPAGFPWLSFRATPVPTRSWTISRRSTPAHAARLPPILMPVGRTTRSASFTLRATSSTGPRLRRRRVRCCGRESTGPEWIRPTCRRLPPTGWKARRWRPLSFTGPCCRPAISHRSMR